MAARSALEACRDPSAALARLCSERPADALPERDFEREVRRLAQGGVRLLPYGSRAYPARIAALADAAPLLAVRGDPASLAGPFAALVGARRPTAYGLGVATRLARELAEHGVGVVSGLALGIDAAAHRGALAAGGRTVAVLGCGPDRVYPDRHVQLAREIAERGAVVSELPPGAAPLAYHFPLRNRLISALAEAVVVIEARGRSGSLITAEHAAEQGREVLAVPGPIDSPESEGPNLLLRDGAAPVLDAGDVLRAIGREPGLLPFGRAEAAAPADPEVRALWLALRAEPATRDELGVRLGLGPQQVSERLLPLELEGRVVEERDGRLRVVAP